MKLLPKTFFVCSNDTDWEAVITEFPLSRTNDEPFDLVITYRGEIKWHGAYKTYRGARNIMGRYQKGWQKTKSI